MGDFPVSEGVKLFFFFVGASATKSFVRSIIFRYGLPNDILTKGEKKAGGGVLQRPYPPPAWTKGLKNVFYKWSRF